MSYTQHGQTNLFERQPDAELVYHSTGLIEGTITYKCEPSTEAQIFTTLGGSHPDDADVTLYAVKVRRSRLWWMATYDCIGLTSEKTEAILTCPNTVSTEPIETHPYFRSPPGWLAGNIDYADRRGNIATADNGALFELSEADSNGDREIVAFLGFVGSEAPTRLRGVRSYYAGNIMCNATYYTRDKPLLKRPATFSDPPGDVPTIEGPVVHKWLHLVSSAEQVGKANIWRVTEQYIAGTANQLAHELYTLPT